MVVGGNWNCDLWVVEGMGSCLKRDLQFMVFRIRSRESELSEAVVRFSERADESRDYYEQEGKVLRSAVSGQKDRSQTKSLWYKEAYRERLRHAGRAYCF